MKTLIKNGSIIDGTGKEAYIGDISFSDGLITGIGRINEGPDTVIIDAGGKCVMPGFIDAHRHADLKVFDDDFGQAEIRQGITGISAGTCGLSAAPCPKDRKQDLYSFLEPITGRANIEDDFETFEKYLEAVKKRKPILNFGCFVGNCTVRIAAKGFETGRILPWELKKAKYYIEEALCAGAKGLSSGLAYSPEDSYNIDEMTQLAKVLKKYEVPLVTHMRGEGNSLLSSVAEVIEIAKRADVPLHISHFKAAGKNNWKWLIHEAMEIIERENAAGMDISCDVYPYEAGATNIIQILPPQWKSGGAEETISKLKDPEMRKRLAQDLDREYDDWDNLIYSTGWGSVMISSVTLEKNRKYIGSDIQSICEQEGVSPVEFISDLIVEEKGRVGKIFFHMDMEDVREVIKWKYSMIASDSLYPSRGLAHPRVYGTYPRMLAGFVRDEKLLSLPEAVFKMSGAPAARFGFEKRGVLKKGNIADIVIIDLDRLVDISDYIDPVNYSPGIMKVFSQGMEIYYEGMK